MKKFFIFLVLIGGIIFSILGVIENNEVTLKITNRTNKTIDYLKLSYTGLKDDIKISEIKPNDKLDFKVDIDKNFQDGAMKIYYVNSNDERREFTVIGYFEKGYSGSVNVSLVEQQGELKIHTN